MKHVLLGTRAAATSVTFDVQASDEFRVTKAALDVNELYTVYPGGCGFREEDRESSGRLAVHGDAQRRWHAFRSGLQWGEDPRIPAQADQGRVRFRVREGPDRCVPAGPA